MKSENYEIFQYPIISFVEIVVKKLSEFHTVKMDAVRYAGKITFKLLEFEFKTFFTIHIQHVVLHVKIWYNFIFICYI
jgi:hypothetical protein